MTPPPLIVHVVHRLGMGGLENGVINLINHLPEERYRHAVVCMTDATDFARRLRRADVALHELHKRDGQDPGVYWRLYRLLRRLRPQIVHTRNIATLEAQIPAAFAGVRTRLHGEHGRDIYDLHGENRRHLLLRRALSPLITCFVPMSQDLAGWLRERVGVPEGRIQQLYNGVDVERFRPREQARGDWPEPALRDPGLFVVGAVGRMQSVKDPLNLGRAFIELCELAGPDLRERLRLVYLGDGPLLEDLRSLLAAHGLLDRCWLPGARDDVPELLPGFDVFALPSLGEGISNTVLEAMACGIPVVATRVGGNPELVTEETGALVPAADPSALARALHAYAAEPRRRERHAGNARARVETEFALGVMVARYDRLYARWAGH